MRYRGHGNEWDGGGGGVNGDLGNGYLASSPPWLAPD